MATETLIRPDAEPAGTFKARTFYGSAFGTTSVLRPQPLSLRDIAVFGTTELKASFQQGQADIARGRSRVFDDIEALIADLHE